MGDPSKVTRWLAKVKSRGVRLCYCQEGQGSLAGGSGYAARTGIVLESLNNRATGPKGHPGRTPTPRGVQEPGFLRLVLGPGMLPLSDMFGATCEHGQWPCTHHWREGDRYPGHCLLTLACGEGHCTSTLPRLESQALTFAGTSSLSGMPFSSSPSSSVKTLPETKPDPHPKGEADPPCRGFLPVCPHVMVRTLQSG